MKKIYSIDNISKLNIPLKIPSIVFLKGDLASGKTTLVKSILNNIFKLKENITSPTYTYYNKYNVDIKKSILEGQLTFENCPLTTELTIYHFDLYRLKDYDEFFAIGAEDIFDNNTGIIFVEWPELIEKYYKADLEIFLEKTEDENERSLEFIVHSS